MATKSLKKESPHKTPSEGVELNFQTRYNQFKKDLDILLTKYDFVLSPKVRFSEKGVMPFLDVEEKPKNNEKR